MQYLAPHMFEAGAIDDGEASLANHLGARPVHVAALVVAAKEVVIEHVVPTPLLAPPLDEELSEARVKVQQEALGRTVRP